MSRKSILVTLACAVIAVGGCAVNASPDAKQSSNSAATQVSQTAFVSKDGKVQISAPSNWQDTLSGDNSGTYNLKLADRSKDLYLMVTTRDKVPGITLEKMAEIGTMGAKGAMQNPKLERTAVKKVGAYPAVEYKLEGQAAGADIVMLVTSIESPKHFHMVMLGGSPSSFATSETDLQKMIQSFKEVKKTASVN